MSSVALKLVLSIVKLVPGGPTAIRVAFWAKSFLARFFGRNKQLGHKGSVLSLNNPDPVSKALEIELINRCGGICMLRLPAAFEIPHLAVPVCIAATSEYLIESGLIASGLFRIPGQTKTINAIYKHFMTQLDDGRNGPFQVEMTIANPTLPTDIPFTIHDITSVYKKFLAGVDGGILGSLTLFNALREVIEPSGVCIENILDASSILTASRIAEIIMEIESRDRYFLITAVFGLLAYIKEREGDVESVEGRKKKEGANNPEKMSSKALGVVFAPLLLGNKTDEIEIESFGKDAGFQQFTKLAANVNKAKANQVTELAYGMARNDLTAAITEGLLLQWSNIACFLQGKYQDFAEDGFYSTQLYIPRKRSSNSILKSRDVSENWPLTMMVEENKSSMKRSITTNHIEIGNRYRPNKGDRTTSLLMFPRECRTRAEYDMAYPPSDTDWEEPSDYSEICRKAKRYREELENGAESVDFDVEEGAVEEILRNFGFTDLKVKAEKKPSGGFAEDEVKETPAEAEEEDEAEKKIDGGDGNAEHIEESRKFEVSAANAVKEIQLPEEPAIKPVRRSSRSSFSRIPRRSVNGLRSRGSTLSSSTSSKNSLQSVPEETEPFPPLYEEPRTEISSNNQEPTTPWRVYRNNNYESQLSLASTDRMDDSILESGSRYKGRRSSSSRIPRFRHMLTGSTMSSVTNTPSPYARRDRTGLTTATPSRLNQVHSHADELLNHVSDIPLEISARTKNIWPSIENRTRIPSSRKYETPRAGRASSDASELSIRTEDFDAIETHVNPEMGNEETAAAAAAAAAAPPPPPPPPPPPAKGQNSKMSALYAELHRTQRELSREKHRNSKLEQDLEAMRRAKGSAFFIERLKEAESQVKQWRERAERAEISCLRRDHEQAGVIQKFVEKRLEARKGPTASSSSSSHSSDGRNREIRGKKF